MCNTNYIREECSLLTFSQTRFKSCITNLHSVSNWNLFGLSREESNLESEVKSRTTRCWFSDFCNLFSFTLNQSESHTNNDLDHNCILQHKIRNMNMILRRKGFQGYGIPQLLIYGIIYSTLKLETLEFVGSFPLILKGFLSCFRFWQILKVNLTVMHDVAFIGTVKYA